MATIGELLVLLGVNNAPLTAGLAKSDAELKGFGSSVSKTSSSAAAGFHAVGIAALAVSGGLVAFGAVAAKQASAFQSAMEMIRTQAGGTQAEVTAMSSAILGLAPQVGVGPDQLAAGLYHIESAGIRGTAALNILRTAAEGAKVGNANLEDVTNAMIGSMTSGIKGISNVTQAMGVLNAVVGAGNMRMQDLAEAMGTGIQSTAKAVGVSMQSLGAAIADMTIQHIPAIDAATRLRMTLSMMEAPTSKAAKALASIGLSGTALAQDLRKPGGILTAVEDLRKHLGGVGPLSIAQTQILMHAFGGGRSSSAILSLVGNVKLLQQTTTQVAKGANDFGAAWTATEQTTAEQGAKVQASIDAITVAVGTGLLPAIGSLLSGITPVITQIAQWTAANPGLSAQILAITAGVAALAAAVFLLTPLIGGIVTFIGLVASPIALVIGAIVGLAAHFGLLGKGAQTTFDGIVNTITKAIPGVISTLGDLASRVVSWISAQIPVWLNQLVQWANAFIAWIGPMIPPALAALGQFALQVLGWIAQQIPVWIANLAKWAVAFVGWVLPMIPKVLGALGQWALQVIGWLIGQIPALEAALNRWANAAIAWVVNSVPGLLGALGNWLTQILTWAQSVLGTVYTAFLNFGLTMAKGIIDGIKNLPSQVAGILNQIPGVSVVGGAIKFGGEVLHNVSSGSQLVGGQAPGVTGGSGQGTGVGTFTGGGSGALPPIHHFGLGGIVPGGIGLEQLAYVHGGETIIPPGYGTASPGLSTNGGRSVLEAHFHIEIGGQPLMEYIERQLFGAASGFSSGFQAPNGITGA